MKRYNIALVFNKEVSEKINAYSQLLCKGLDSDFIVGKNAMPHMTIAQFEIEDSFAQEIWNQCLKTIDVTPELHFSGITILPSSNSGAWIEISVLKGEELLVLQKNVKKIIDPYSEIKNDVGNKYRPHITVAHTSKGDSINEFPFSYEPLRLKSVQTTLGIGLGIKFEPLDPSF